MTPLPACRLLVWLPRERFTPRVENPSFQVTPDNLHDLNLVFGIDAERFESGQDGEVYLYRVTIRSGRSRYSNAERRTHSLRILHGRIYIAESPVQEVEKDGELSYRFSVASAIARESDSTFSFSLISGFDGHHYWFYLRDFAPTRPAKSSA